MSVKDRLLDAQFLWDHGRKESAFVLVLIAFAATSKKRYPRPIRDPDSFKRFAADVMGTITGGPKYNVKFPFDGKDEVWLGDILYTHLRCQLVHEAEMPPSIVFTEPQIREGQVYNVLKLTSPLGFPEGWVRNLAKAVTEAPENQALFGGT